MCRGFSMTKSRWFDEGRAGRIWTRGALVTVVACVWCLSWATTTRAQAASSPNAGALHFTGRVDVPSAYVFRGFVQETDPNSGVGANCTNYAAYVESTVYGVPAPHPVGLGNATDWAVNAPKDGFTVNHTPTVGSVIQYLSERA